jgi:phosphoribosylformylglycinamidine synthase
LQVSLKFLFYAYYSSNFDSDRERCGFSDVGRVTGKDQDGETRLILTDRDGIEYPKPIDLPMSILFPKDRRLERIVQSRKLKHPDFDSFKSVKNHFATAEALSDQKLLTKAVETVLKVPAVGSKSFLITIGDRTVGGMTTRDQMVGPWQTPVADVAVTATALSMGGASKNTGEAMCMGEKPTIALISPAASARMAIAESLLNLAAADIQGGLSRVRLSANWMVAVNHLGEGAALYEAVQAIGMEMCPRLGVSIPVGKDSTSMKASWKDRKSQESKTVTAPLTVVISAFAPVQNVRNTWTPTLRRLEDVGETILLFVDLAQGRQAMGGSALAQAMGQLGNEAPDVRDVDLISDYFDAVSQLQESGIVLAYHDRSDGGLFTTLVEMMFAGRCGAEVMLDGIAKSDHLFDILNALFNEELGAIFQVRKSDEINFRRCFATCGPPPGLIRKIGRVSVASKQKLSIYYSQRSILSLDRSEMQQWWSSTSYHMQRLRDNPASADSEFSMIGDDKDPGLSFRLTFDPKENILPLTAMLSSPFVKAPRVAILREQGVNGHAEMAFAFKVAGFDPIDIHMTDIISGRTLADFVGIAACGGFSYGDVLGAGQGWAKSILMHEENARPEFQKFFERKDTFALGVCNGCQMLSRIAELIPGTEHWPLFVDNESQQFEARVSMIQIRDTNTRNPSVFLHGMSGSSLPIAVSHGEGRAAFRHPSDLQALNEAQMIPIRYVDNYGKVTTKYPANPNGSPEGIAGVRSRDGRVLALMPHPERTIMADVGSYIPAELVEEWGEFGPWVRMFKSARRWVG